MSFDLEKIKAAAAASSPLSHDIARVAKEHASWYHSSIAKQVTELAMIGSAYEQVTKSLKILQPDILAIGQQYKDLLGSDSVATQAIRQWQKTQHAEHEHIRKMLAPLSELRGGSLAGSALKELGVYSSIQNPFKNVLDQALGLGSTAKMWAQQIEASQAHTKRLPLEDLSVGHSLQMYLKDFEHINKQWAIPSEVLSVVGSLRELQVRFGKVALPTIDWGSAAALAKLLGQEGVEEQLAYLGIEPDGSLHQPTETPEKGLLSRKQADALAILSLLLTFLILAYQEYSNAQQQAKTEAFQAQTTAALQVQAQKIQSLSILLEAALVQAAQAPEDRFVVRERTATIRSKPEHGAAVEGKLLPNEVVRAIDYNGKWVEIEYYHWLHEKYRTGWILKKYLERVPTSLGKQPKR